MTARQTTVGQTAPEQPVAQPTTAPTMERVAKDLAREGADINAPIRDDGAAGTPPPSSVVEEGKKGSIPCSGGGAAYRNCRTGGCYRPR